MTWCDVNDLLAFETNKINHGSNVCFHYREVEPTIDGNVFNRFHRIAFQSSIIIRVLINVSWDNFPIWFAT